MQILYDPSSLGPCVLVLGMFDGVHLGHRELIRTGRSLADERGLPLVAMTFDPHPSTVFAPVPAPLLTTVEERALRMAEAGVDMLAVRSFTKAYAALSPAAFLEELDRVYRPAAIVCGFNYTFGSRGSGNGETLQAWGEAHGCTVTIVPAYRLAGDTVSSTRIRRLLQEDRLAEANALLGAPYPMIAPVAHGKHLGHSLGFPTANLTVSPGKVLPAFGVYTATLTVDGTPHPTVVNVGRQPTLPSGHITVEAFLLDGPADLYGQTVCLELLRKQRGEQKFAGPMELSEQIGRDVEEAKGWIEENHPADTSAGRNPGIE